MPRKTRSKWNPDQHILSPHWYVDSESATEIVWRHLPEEKIAKFSKKFELSRFRFEHFKVVLAAELQAKAITCPHEIQAYEARVLREFRRGKRKWPKFERTPSSGGRPPVGADAYLRAKLLAPFYEVEDNSEALHRELSRNGNYLISCRFYDHAIPDVRTLQYYEHVMIWSGLWHEWKRDILAMTHEAGLWDGQELAVDPTHATDYASVRKTSAESKRCGCERCVARPVMTCSETDVVSKSSNFKMPGVKAGIVTDVNSELPLIATSFNARIFDGKMGAKLLEDCKRLCPQIDPSAISLDSAFDGAAEKALMAEVYPDAEFFIDPNPRRRKPVPYDDPYIEALSPKGVPQCRAGNMDFYTRNTLQGRFIFSCPGYDKKTGKNTCPHAEPCCGGVDKSRYKTVPKDSVPYVDWDNPHFGHRFKQHYKKRTATERVNGRAKWSLPFERVWGRGKNRIQAHWDKMIAAFHLYAYAAHQEGLASVLSILHPYRNTG